MRDFEERCKSEPDKVIKYLMECQSRQALIRKLCLCRPCSRIFDYSNKISELESEIELIHKVVKKVTSPEVFDKFNSQLEKKKQKSRVDK